MTDRPGPTEGAEGAAAPRGLQRLRAWRYDAELRGLAPHVDGAWAEAFVVELRLRDVPGRTIGAALAEVESHCAESGEQAEEAFGEPVAYAVSLGLRPEVDPAAHPFSLGSALRWLVQAVGLLVTTTSVTSLHTGRPLELTSGLVVMGLVLLGTLVALTRAVDRSLRFVVEHTVAAWALSMVHLGLLVGLLVVLDDVLVLVPAGPALVVGIALLVIGTGAVAWDLQREDRTDDPVTGPLEADGEVPARLARTMARIRYLPALLVPFAALVFVGVTLLLG